MIDGGQVGLILSLLPLGQVGDHLFDEWHNDIDVLGDERLRQQVPLGVDDLLAVELVQLVVKQDVLLGYRLLEPLYCLIDQI